MMADMQNIIKTAQALAGKTVGDLYQAVMSDRGVSDTEKQQLIAQLDRRLGSVPENTPLSRVMGLLGGGLGYLISKYFGAGGIGQALMAATGLGLGTLISNHMKKDPGNSMYDKLYGSTY